MRVVANGKTPVGVIVQIEDWSENYPEVYKPCTTIVAYPVSLYTIEGSFAPKAGEKFRAQFDFSNWEETREAFDLLVSGEKKLVDYIDHLYYKHHTPCITGRE